MHPQKRERKGHLRGLQTRGRGARKWEIQSNAQSPTIARREGQRKGRGGGGDGGRGGREPSSLLNLKHRTSPGADNRVRVKVGVRARVKATYKHRRRQLQASFESLQP